MLLHALFFVRSAQALSDRNKSRSHPDSGNAVAKGKGVHREEVDWHVGELEQSLHDSNKVRDDVYYSTVRSAVMKDKYCGWCLLPI